MQPLSARCLRVSNLPPNGARSRRDDFRIRSVSNAHFGTAGIASPSTNSACLHLSGEADGQW